MLNEGESGVIVLEPPVVRVRPGEPTTSSRTDKSHDVQSVKGMLPEGVDASKGENENFDLTVTEEGVYGVNCTSQFPMVMVALVVVGDPFSNLEAAKSVKHPRKAHERIDAGFGRDDGVAGKGGV